MFGIGFFIGIVLCVIPGIIFAVVFGFYGFVAAEQGNAAVPMETLQARHGDHSRPSLAALRPRDRARC